MKKKLRALIISGEWGHLSLAKALQEILSGRLGNENVKLITLKSNTGQNIYNIFYLYFPSLFRFPFWASQLAEIKKVVKQFGSFYKNEIEREFRSFKPNLVFTTFFLGHYPVEKLLGKEGDFKFFNFISDPVSIHPLLFSQKAINLVYDQNSVNLGTKYGINKNRIIPVGWPIRQQFYQPLSKSQARKRLKLDEDLLTFLICGGSEGTNAIIKILPALLKVKKPIQILIVAGKNTVLYKLSKSFERLLSGSFYIWESRLKIKVFQFIKELAPLIKAADLVVGKAGPNLIFETVIAERPFFAITHIHGQEDGNLDLIRKKKLGWVEEDGSRAAELLLKIINHPAMLDRWEKYILKEKKHLQSTGEKILNLALQP